jgi:trehalose 6-phosphate phosphatase
MSLRLPHITRNWALFLDVDGTMLDYVARPESVRVPPSFRETLRTLATALDGALAIVTGRKIEDVDNLFAPLCLPVAGQHGAELRRDHSLCAFAPAPAELEAILAPVYAVAERKPAIWVENKGFSAAVHYRGAEAEREALARLLSEAIDRQGAGFRLLPGHLVFDVTQRTVNKGSAVDWFMSAAPFLNRMPVFIGDEGTDEDGFAAVLARGGLAIRIGLEGESLAPHRMRSPAELRAWLDRSADALAQRV